ncbi:MAG: hypothetical protein IPP31_14685 [Chitinophagaceae bacterium]|nr:hypothetical protein [Chitinophagaceae bacterium]
MKRIFFILAFSGLATTVFAQQEEEKKETKKGGFKKENLFTGGGLTVSFSSYTTVLGASPVFGYSINKWVDAGIVVNFNYSANRHITYYDPYTYQYYYSDDKLRQFQYGPGAFVRVYPIKFLFVQAQGELNFINQKIIYADGSPSGKQSLSAPSLLVGGGYCNGREGTGSLFYYVSILADVARNRNSPYVEELSNGKVNVLPIIRAGLQVPLFQGKGRRGF